MSRLSYEEINERRGKRDKTRNDATVGRANHYKKWTSEEDEVVSDESLSIEEKASILKRSIRAVKSRMYRIGATKELAPEWSEDELILLFDPSLGTSEMAEMLPNRSQKAVEERRRILKSMDLDVPTFKHEYTDEEIEFIRTHSVKESSEFVGVSEAAIEGTRKRLIHSGRMKATNRPYDKDEIAILSDESLSDEECSVITGRTLLAVKRKRYQMKKEHDNNPGE